MRTCTCGTGDAGARDENERHVDSRRGFADTIREPLANVRFPVVAVAKY